ncbi:MAG: hypothetical protein AB4040_11990 [Synechococcus sp.]
MRLTPKTDIGIEAYQDAVRYELFGARLRMYINIESVDRHQPIAEQLQEWHGRLLHRHRIMDDLLEMLSALDPIQ